jgi:hypothetical protein
MQVASVKQSNVYDGREEAFYLVQGQSALYNVQCKDYDNLVKYNSWEGIAEELHAQDTELSRRTQHCRKMAWEQHGMCESAFSGSGSCRTRGCDIGDGLA